MQPDTRNVERIFLSSPSDLVEEQGTFEKVIKNVNVRKANSLGIQLEAVRGIDTLPGIGRPQGLINPSIESCSLFICAFWKRWGHPTAEFSSGTEEELIYAKELNEKHGRPDIFVLFRDLSAQEISDPDDQLQEVLAFRRKLEEDKSDRAVKFDTFKDSEHWNESIETLIHRWLDKLKRVAQDQSTRPANPSCLTFAGGADWGHDRSGQAG